MNTNTPTTLFGQTGQTAQLPIIDSRETDTQVMVKDGETLVIGGLVKEDVSTTRQKIPLLGDIPLLGLLFSNKTDIREQRDLIIFITPRIVKMGELTYPQSAIAESMVKIPSSTSPGNKGFLVREK